MPADFLHTPWLILLIVIRQLYMELIPQAREIAEHAKQEGKNGEFDSVEKVINEILARPEHQWFEAEKQKRDKSAKNMGEILEKVAVEMPDRPREERVE